MFILLTETWLKDHKDAELFIEDYQLLRTDRKRIKKSSRGRDSGGVACYIRNDIAPSFEIILQYTDGVIEILCIYSKTENLILGVVQTTR